eukprot:scaffold15.g4291.t1
MLGRGRGSAAVVLLGLALAAAAAAGAAGDALAWKVGRATYYGAPGDTWSIHDGSCTHQYLWPDVGTGWDAGAISDQNAAFIGSCGRCYEIKCNPGLFKDGYGTQLDRTTVCRDTAASVVITIVDACPCYYSSNAYSNKRWCCGDMDHFDISVWSFEKLAELKWGVIELLYRPVPCDYQPVKPAPKPANPTPGIPPPPGAQHP